MPMDIDRMVLEMDRDALIVALQDACIQCPSPSDMGHEDDNTLREAVRVNIEDGTIDPGTIPF